MAACGFSSLGGGPGGFRSPEPGARRPGGFVGSRGSRGGRFSPAGARGSVRGAPGRPGFVRVDVGGPRAGDVRGLVPAGRAREVFVGWVSAGRGPEVFVGWVSEGRGPEVLCGWAPAGSGARAHGSRVSDSSWRRVSCP
ncbi:hypothetical protein SAM23877_2416 [Streptomyces ambofaciens ATCC 23877]|uniref:Uncharacterized protein n=1 Tax=Streptomyces ambofaciens (strain ATCC 23877 / 3486 / DSM 40053 / JCM 4204 / NBRC 12836 / NRRL B-2516) TaxID=278992 RepID=A0A0K2AQS9_STRA7|nr:hypothetical protein SAM23877_2416 [Streptomyces ambofaciens ATCC 23877]